MTTALRRFNLPRFLCLLLSLVTLPSTLTAQIRSDAPADMAVYAVSYVEVMPASRAMAIATLKQYRDASRKDEGYVRLELFEQIGRSGHFVFVETWKDQKALDAHETAAHTKQISDMLQPIRSSDHDRRPYKTFTVGSAPATPNGRAIYVVTHVDTAPAPQTDTPGLLKRFAEASRKEDGNVRFDVLQHTTRANHFTVIETWQSQKALDAHAAAAHTRQYRDELHPITGSPLDERLYKVVE